MDPRLLERYNSELRYIREMGAEFAKENPGAASRLGLDQFECADPYVERLLEGFAFLTARIQLKIDDEFPRFSQHLLEMVYPHYLAPLPSMAVVELAPDLSDGGLADGFVVRREATLRGPLAPGQQTPCEYRTAHDVTLWPVEVAEARYATLLSELRVPDLSALKTAKAGLRLRIRSTAGLGFAKTKLRSLVLYLRGGEVAHRIYEQMFANVVAVIARPAESPTAWHEVIDRWHLRQVGFDDGEALIPYGTRSFPGYRLLSEYFAFPERFLFVEVGGLEPAVRRCTGSELEILLLFDRSEPTLANALHASNFALFCTPAVNLFPKRAESIQLSDRVAEHHVVPDRNAPMDFEVYDVTSVTGAGGGATAEREFLPFYTRRNPRRQGDETAYYSLRRLPRLLSERQRRHGPRSPYIGSEVFLSLVDAREAPYSPDLRQLHLRTLCTNRDLPLHLATGQGTNDFTLQVSAPLKGVRCVSGPTTPRPAHANGEAAWRLISHLSLNYLTLLDGDRDEGAGALRDLLLLYGGEADPERRLQVDGLRSVVSTPVMRRIPLEGRSTFGRGLEIAVTFDETAFAGSGAFLLGSILERFFAKYVSLNVFTETVVRSLQRGEIIRWPIRTGRRDPL